MIKGAGIVMQQGGLKNENHNQNHQEEAKGCNDRLEPRGHRYRPEDYKSLCIWSWRYTGQVRRACWDLRLDHTRMSRLLYGISPSHCIRNCNPQGLRIAVSEEGHQQAPLRRSQKAPSLVPQPLQSPSRPQGGPLLMVAAPFIGNGRHTHFF